MSAVGAAQYVAKAIDNIVGLDDDLVWRNSEVYSMLRDIQEELALEVQPAAGITLTTEEAAMALFAIEYTRHRVVLGGRDQAQMKALEAKLEASA